MRKSVGWAAAAVMVFCATVTWAAEKKTEPIRVACIGDSITAGARIPQGEKSYPTQLKEMLGKGYEVRNFGMNGTTMLKKGDNPYWNDSKLWGKITRSNPNIVIIMLGSNDTKEKNWQHKADFVTNYVEMIECFQKMSSNPKVYICHPPPAFPQNFGITDKVIKGELIPLIDKVGETKSVTVIDNYKPMEGKPELVVDKVHPNGKGAEVIANTVYAAITGKTPKAEQDTVANKQEK